MNEHTTLARPRTVRTSAARGFAAAAGISGVFQILLGVVFWTGHLMELVPLHMAIGGVFVLAQWGLCAIGLESGLRLRSGLTFAWSLVVPALGFAQVGLLPGPWHWAIRALHLIVGLVAMRFGRDLAARMLGGRPAHDAARPMEIASARR